MISSFGQRTSVVVTVVVPVFDGAGWLSSCFGSILRQNVSADFLEVSVYNDGSTDGSDKICQRFKEIFRARNILFTYSSGESCCGVGFSKNRAVGQSCGKYLCFQDVDDEMLPDRIMRQYETCVRHPFSLIGSRFIRDPPLSTERYTRWANTTTQAQLYTQAYTSHGPTLIAPTWFCSRELFNRVGDFNESAGAGFPEDLDFFYRFLEKGGTLLRVDQELVLYRYHQRCASFSVSEKVIWDMRLKQFQCSVLTRSRWDKFTIWNAGKQGKQFFRSLDEENRKKVIGYCDVDPKKIARGYYEFWDASTRKISYKLPIVDYRSVAPPVVICVKLDFTGGLLEKELERLGWKEGWDYFWMS